MKLNIKKGFRDKTLLSFTTRAGFLAALFVLLSSSAFANVFRYVQTAPMDAEQTHYYNVILSEETTLNTYLFTFDFQALKGNAFTLNLPDGTKHQVDKRDNTVTLGSRDVFSGKVGNGELHLAPDLGKQYLTGTILLGEKTFAVRSLTKGLHVLIEFDSENAGECQNPLGDFSPSEEAGYTPDPHSVDGHEESPENSVAFTDECYIRILVAYTQPVGAAEADPVGLIMSAVAMANSAYTNSGIDQQLQLARVYETPYDDTGQSQSTVLGAWRSTTDGNMDEVHGQRSLYRADMCALITNVGTGVAYTGVSAANAFSCTRRTYISNLTFQHELGHNHSCQHDPLNYGGGSNYRGYGNPSGLFRTVMAYGSACGASPCTRVNEFSGVTNTYFIFPIFYSTGNATQDNVSGHNNNNGTIVAYQSIVTNAWYAGTYNFPDDEYANFAGEDSIRYNGSGGMVYESGSSGSFTAGLVVKLQDGFWAKSGSTFSAVLDPNCTAISANGEPPVTEFQSGQIGNEITHEHKHDLGIDDIAAFPNPFSETATIQYSVKTEGPVSVMIYDMNGKLVKSLVNSNNHANGQHNVTFDGSNLPVGMYQCRMITQDGVKVIGLSLSK